MIKKYELTLLLDASTSETELKNIDGGNATQGASVEVLFRDKTKQELELSRL